MSHLSSALYLIFRLVRAPAKGGREMGIKGEREELSHSHSSFSFRHPPEIARQELGVHGWDCLLQMEGPLYFIVFHLRPVPEAWPRESPA